jgi:hypothetical protein
VSISPAPTIDLEPKIDRPETEFSPLQAHWLHYLDYATVRFHSDILQGYHMVKHRIENLRYTITMKKRTNNTAAYRINSIYLTLLTVIVVPDFSGFPAISTVFIETSA